MTDSTEKKEKTQRVTARLFKAQRFGCKGPAWFLLMDDGTEIQTETEPRAIEIAKQLQVDIVRDV